MNAHRRSYSLGAAVILIAAAEMQARYIRPEIEQVPVGRLIENLEKSIEANPKDAGLRYNLARVHGMAYALKSEQIPVNKRTPNAAWFGYEPKFVPFDPQATDDEAKLQAARQHLRQAIRRYEETVALAPDHLAARLGLAWTTEKSGDRKKAIEGYRDLVERGWAKEKDLKEGGLGAHFITAEAGAYLVPLLDPEKDAVEIASLKERSARLAKLPRPVTPIAIPLRPGLRAVDLVDAKASVAFDADGSGLDQRWTWIAPDAGWLVYDAAPDGKIASGLQLFGNATFGLSWSNGYQALASLDDDGDGMLSGDELKHIAVWHDRNGDGRVQPGEKLSLASLGIVAISCRFETDRTHADRIAWSRTGATLRDGSTLPTYDLILKRK